MVGTCQPASFTFLRLLLIFVGDLWSKVHAWYFHTRYDRRCTVAFLRMRGDVAGVLACGECEIASADGV